MLSQKAVKRVAAVIAAILVGTMLFSLLAGGLASAGAATVSQLRQQLTDIENQQKKIKEEIAALNKQVEVVSEKKAKLEEQMILTEDEITAVESIIDELANEIKVTEQELIEAQIRLADMQQTFEKRIRNMYEQDDTSYLDVVLGSDSFSTMIQYMEYVSRIMDYDKKLLESYEAAKEAVAAAKAKLESDKAEQENYKGTLEVKYDELEDQRAEQQALQNELENNIELKQSESEKMESEKASITADIAELSRKAAEAAAAAKRNGTTSSSGVPYSGSFSWPLPSRGTLTSAYGWRNLWGKQNFHSGTDIAIAGGTTIMAAAPGTVVKSGMYSSYGNYVVVDHGGGVMTGYAHMSRRSVTVGQQVSTGQKLGEVGSTGNSSGNHLHFQVFINGSTTDPMKYFN